MPRRRTARPAPPDEDLRIIGGEFRARRLRYEPHTDRGEAVTRPMKHRVRESIFNLVGPAIKDTHALDLFAGTGALGLEALSRGARRATFIERHVPTAAVVRENVSLLGVEDRAEVLVTSAFLWAKRDLPELDASLPWACFVSPPYAFYLEREAEMLNLVERLQGRAPPGSMIVVEADARFDTQRLPGEVKESRHDAGWDVRAYAPAVVAVWRVSDDQAA